MLQAGKNITKIDDTLTKIQKEYLLKQILSPQKEILSHIRHLRIVKSIDKKQYNSLKKQLPYIVCGIFNPPFRKTENFAYVENFIIDLDHFSEYNQDITIVRKEIEKDPRTVMSFMSPSEDGLKIMFHLKEKCYDHGKYSLFYKCFVHSFAMQYHLEQLTDIRTSDVTRACFISYDENAYYNEAAESVSIDQYLNFEDTQSISELKFELNKIEKEKERNEEKEKSSNDPDDEAIQYIRAKLNPKIQKEKVPVYVPVVLNDIIDNLCHYLFDLGFNITEIKNIQYGKKISLVLGNKRGEINLFYGKKGFSIVQSPKTGTSVNINQLAADCIINYLSEQGYQ